MIVLYQNVDTIKLEPDTSSGNWYERVSNSFETEGTQEVQGYVEIDGERIPVNGGGSIESNGEIKYDKFKFILTTNAFIFEEIDEMEIKVRIGGQEITYVPTFNENKISVILSGNNKSIEKESADVTLSIRNKNGLRYILPFRINKDGEIKNF